MPAIDMVAPAVVESTARALPTVEVKANGSEAVDSSRSSIDRVTDPSTSARIRATNGSAKKLAPSRSINVLMRSLTHRASQTVPTWRCSSPKAAVARSVGQHPFDAFLGHDPYHGDQGETDERRIHRVTAVLTTECCQHDAEQKERG